MNFLAIRGSFLVVMGRDAIIGGWAGLSSGGGGPDCGCNPQPRTLQSWVAKQETQPASTLHVRNVPETLYESIRHLAQASSRSLSAEVVELLGQAVAEAQRRARIRELLADMKQNRIRPPAGAPRAEQLIREDRDQ